MVRYPLMCAPVETADAHSLQRIFQQPMKTERGLNCYRLKLGLTNEALHGEQYIITVAKNDEKYYGTEQFFSLLLFLNSPRTFITNNSAVASHILWQVWLHINLISKGLLLVSSNNHMN